jgi:hypothetical protein
MIQSAGQTQLDRLCDEALAALDRHRGQASNKGSSRKRNKPEAPEPKAAGSIGQFNRILRDLGCK